MTGKHKQALNEFVSASKHLFSTQQFQWNVLNWNVAIAKYVKLSKYNMSKLLVSVSTFGRGEHVC